MLKLCYFCLALFIFWWRGLGGQGLCGHIILPEKWFIYEFQCRTSPPESWPACQKSLADVYRTGLANSHGAVCLQCYLIYTRPDMGEQRGLFWDIPHRWIRFLQLERFPPYVLHFRFWRWAARLWTQLTTRLCLKGLNWLSKGNNVTISRVGQTIDWLEGLHRKLKISLIISALFLLPVFNIYHYSKQSL